MNSESIASAVRRYRELNARYPNMTPDEITAFLLALSSGATQAVIELSDRVKLVISNGEVTAHFYLESGGFDTGSELDRLLAERGTTLESIIALLKEAAADEN